VSVDPALDPDAPVALYVQLAGVLIARIEGGQITGRLPSVLELAAEFHVARDTAGKALRVLASTGRATSVRGRGYYVTSSDPMSTTATGQTICEASEPNRMYPSSTGAAGS
jgi:DNA-binding GntR family transcriptional regulator